MNRLHFTKMEIIHDQTNMCVCWLWLVGFYVISTFVGYLMPNLSLCEESVLFLTIQFSMRTQSNDQKHFYFKLFSLFKQF